MRFLMAGLAAMVLLFSFGLGRWSRQEPSLRVPILFSAGQNGGSMKCLVFAEDMQTRELLLRAKRGDKITLAGRCDGQFYVFRDVTATITQGVPSMKEVAAK